jgi:hypothetical protein
MNLSDKQFNKFLTTCSAFLCRNLILHSIRHSSFNGHYILPDKLFQRKTKELSICTFLSTLSFSLYSFHTRIWQQVDLTLMGTKTHLEIFTKLVVTQWWWLEWSWENPKLKIKEITLSLQKETLSLN